MLLMKNICQNDLNRLLNQQDLSYRSFKIWQEKNQVTEYSEEVKETCKEKAASEDNTEELSR